MRRLLLFGTLLCIALAADPIVKHPRDLHFPAREFTAPKAAAYRHTLSNGAVAFLVEDHEFPLINIAVTVRTGSYLDPAGKEGLASMMGRQMSMGGTKTKSPAAFDEETAFLAAQIRSGVSEIGGEAGLNCLSKDLDAGLAAVYRHACRNPAFDEARLKIAKSASIQQMQRRNDSTGSIEQREFRRLLRGEHHFTTAETTKASIESITRQDLLDFHDRYYYPSSFILAVSGDFDTKQMLAKLEQALANWPNRDTRVPDLARPRLHSTPGVYIVDKKDVNQGRVEMGHIGVAISNPDHLALEVMNGILGGNNFTSRIFARVRTDEGLAYHAGSSFHAGTYYAGVFAVELQSKSPSVAQAIAISIEEMQRLQTAKVSAEELETATNSAVEGLPLRFSTAGRKAGQFASDYYTHLPEDYWQNYTRRIRALTADEIQRVARKYLHPDQLVILAVGNADAIMRGNPDRPQYSISKLAGDRGVTRLPLPDPLTMLYP